MFTLSIKCEVSPERTVTLQLPEQVEPGTHELVVVLDTLKSAGNETDDSAALMRLAGSVPAFAATDAVAYQRSLRDEWT